LIFNNNGALKSFFGVLFLHLGEGINGVLLQVSRELQDYRGKSFLVGCVYAFHVDVIACIVFLEEALVSLE
jgi:hypothetical protein